MSGSIMKKCILILSILTLLSLPVQASETVLKATDADGAVATLTLASSPLLSMTPTDLRLSTNRAHGDGLMIKSAVCDLTMPAMSMPENRLNLHCEALGCTGQAIFTMAGAWAVTCKTTFSGGNSSEFVFVADKVRLK